MNLNEFITTIRGWTGYNDPAVVSNALITSWVRMGEERLNTDLRIADMVQIDTATIYNRRVVTPTDWIKNDFLRMKDVGIIRYMSRDEFYSKDHPDGHYTTSGKFLIVGGPVDKIEGRKVELHYFGDVPQLGADPNWVTQRYVRLLTSSTMIPASMYLREPEQAILWETDLTAAIAKLNDSYQASQASGSKLVAKTKGFG